MSSLSAYRGLLAVLDAGSVSGAARSLGVPRPTLSRWLSELEEQLGVRLFHRSPSGVVPTRAGQVLADQLRPSLRALEDAEDAVRRMDDVPRGLLRVSVPPPLVAELCALVTDYLKRCPEVEVELLSVQHVVDLRAEQIDVAVRGGALQDPSLVARRLRSFDVVAVASPGLLAAHSPVCTPADLVGLPCLRAHDQRGRPQSRWPLRSGGQVEVAGPLVTNDRNLLREAAIAGVGVALLARSSAAPALAGGHLTTVLPEQVGTTSALHVVYADRRFLPARVRVFVDTLVAGMIDDGA